MLELARETRGGIYMTFDELAPHGDESVKFLVNDEVFYHAEDLTGPAGPDSGMDMRQGSSGPGPGPKLDDAAEDQDDGPIYGKEEKTNGVDLEAIERDLLISSVKMMTVEMLMDL